VARGWVEEIAVQIEYQGLRGPKLRRNVVKPYLIEPSPWSTSVYVIGESDRHEGMAVFKVGRIYSAKLTTQQFSIPADFDEDRLLRYAWGIWFDEGPPVRVRLRFMPGYAAKRLRETHWHPNESVEETEDGGCTWEVQVAAWEETQPWVSGWGAEVEVLEPVGLREAVRGDVERLVSLYGDKG
jgi:CRISPR-associated endonuclease/helicase Cas3